MQLRRLTRSLALLALVAAPIPALAQTPPAGGSTTTTTMQSRPRHEGIGIGIKAGGLFADLGAEAERQGFKKHAGFLGGLFIGGNRGGRLGVGVDLLYARKSFEDPTGALGNLDYINVPVYLRINVGSERLDNVSVYAIGGADLNFLLKADSPNDSKLKDKFERADYGAVVGLGVEVTRFIIEGRFTQGLGNIAKATGAADSKTKAFAVMIGFRFN